ncbi:MAG: FtsX-like permease family protein [Acidimicrobiales bacterium]
MTVEALRAASYRFAVTFRERRSSYLTVVILVGLVGGLALGAIGGARRTQSSYSTYLASINPLNLEIGTAFDNPSLGSSVGYDPRVAPKLAQLPFVRTVETVVGFDGNIAGNVTGAHLRVGAGEKPPVFEAGLGGEYITEDRVHLVAGRLANPADPHEAIMNAQAAQELGVHLGSVIRFGLNSDDQERLIASSNGPSSLPPVKVVSIKLVGLVVFPFQVVEDQYDALGSAEILATPALAREFAPCCAYYSFGVLRLVGGSRSIARVASEITHSGVVSKGLISALGFMTLAPSISSADRAIRPEGIALGVFGAFAGLAALIIASQVIGRQLRRRADEFDTLRALGASPFTIMADGMIGTLASVIVGSLLAIVVAVALSPLFPLGPVGRVTPISVAFDWTVLGLGFVSLVLVLGGVTLLFSYRQLPHRLLARDRLDERPSDVARVIASSGLPASAEIGVRFALESRNGRDAVPVRSVILGAALAILVVVATVTFGSSLNTLLSRPRLYGWNWNYMLLSGFSGDEDLPAGQTASLLARDHDVVAATGVYFSRAQIEGQDVGVLGTTPNAAVGPAILTGHGLRAANEIVLGSATMAALHTHVGQTLEVDPGGKTSVRLIVAGTATMPTLMGLDMGDGAVIDYRLIPAPLRNTQGSSTPGPNAFLIETRGGDSKTNLLSLQQITATINRTPVNQGSAGGAISVLRPTEIVNSGSIEAIPTILGAGLAAGAVVALGSTLIASVRRRRHDLAVLKTLGLSRRQLAMIIRWQSSVAITIGTLVGVPSGIAVGRLLWVLFARGIHAVPEPRVPALTVVAIALGALALANIVAAVPGRIAARTQTAALLRAE